MEKVYVVWTGARGEVEYRPEGKIRYKIGKLVKSSSRETDAGLYFGWPGEALAAIKGCYHPKKVFEVEPEGKMLQIKPGLWRATALRVIRKLDIIHILSELANHENCFVRKEVAANPLTPPQILSKLSKDGNDSVRAWLALNPNTPPDSLSELSKDKDGGVRRWVASNPKVSPQILSELAEDEDDAVRMDVGRNPNTPVRILFKLANDERVFVRGAVAFNPKLKVWCNPRYWWRLGRIRLSV